jgi:quercetin dioxygenase-like cupin family protein
LHLSKPWKANPLGRSKKVFSTFVTQKKNKVSMSNLIEVAKIFVSNESIEYADGSVVSKTIVKKPAGNITLFAFDKGEGLAEHSSPHDALVQLLDGKAEIMIGGSIHNLQPGQNIILPANVPHALKAIEKFKMMLTMIKS